MILNIKGDLDIEPFIVISLEKDKDSGDVNIRANDTLIAWINKEGYFLLATQGIKDVGLHLLAE